MTVNITNKRHWAGFYEYFLDNGFSLQITHRPELREWHLFAQNPDGHSIEVCHPFFDSLREAKANIPLILINWKEKK